MRSTRRSPAVAAQDTPKAGTTRRAGRRHHARTAVRPTGRRRAATWWQRYLRPAVTVILGMAAVAVAAQAAAVLAGRVATALGGHPDAWWVPIAGAAGALGAYLAFVRFVERRPATELAPAPAPAELSAGLAIGALLFTATIGVLLALGLYATTRSGTLTALGTPLGLALGSGVVEELVVRGLLLRNLIRPLGTYGAIGATSLLFGAAHLGNPSATVGGALAIALEAGVLLGAAYAATGRLWVPIGLHAAWNLTQGGIFGVAVSGSDFGSSLLSSRPLAGHAAITGGPFGVEASPVAVLTCLVVAVPLLVLARRRGRIEPPPWRRPRATAPRAPELPTGAWPSSP